MQSSEAFYTSGHYLESNPTWHEEDAPWKAGNVLRLLQRNGLEPRRIVEVGTGSGEVLKLLAEKLPESDLVGYDISPQAKALAAPKARDRLEFRLGSPFDQSEQSHLVLALDVFEHVEDYWGFLRQVRKVGKYQVYNIPLDLSVRYLLQHSLIDHLRETVGHIHYFTKGTALATLRDTGHRVIDSICDSKSMLPQAGQGLGPALKGRLRRALYRASPDLTARVMGGFSLTVLCE